MAQLQDTDRLNLAPKKFNMWIFLFTSFMLFAALTSGFIVYSGQKGHAMHIVLPDAFRYSTVVILLSSVTMYFSSRSAKQSRFDKMRLFLGLTVVLGLLFFGIQIYGWSQLIKMGAYFVNPNASLSFIYVFTGIHLAHIFAGLLLLLNTLWVSNKKRPQVIVQFKIEMTSIFWHFVDIIWIYLYVFLLLNQR